MRGGMIRMWMLGSVMALGPSTFAQQPKPEPVTPPPVVPGQKPPKSPAVPRPPADTAQADKQARPAAAKERPIAAGEDAAVQPFLDENTLAVLRIDLDHLNLAGYQQWLNQIIGHAKLGDARTEKAKKEVGNQFKTAGDIVDRLTKAGSSRAYVIASLVDLPDHPPFVVIPLKQGADGEAVMSALRHAGSAEVDSGRAAVEKIGNAIVFAHPNTVTRIKQAPAAKPNPDLAPAMEAAGPGPVRLAVIPGDAVRQMLQAAAPQLPDELGGGSVDLVTVGVRWMSASLGAPPNVDFKFLVQARDPNDAKALEELGHKTADAIRKRAKDWELPFDVDQALSLLTPKQQGDRLVTSLDADQMRKLVTNMALPTLASASRQASRVASANHIRQLTLGCLMYANAHKDGQWPGSLDQLPDQFGGKAELAKLTANPDRPDESPGYIYRKTVNPNKNTATTVVLYEAHAQWDRGINVGFADGHVEFISDEASVKRMLEK